MMAFALGFDLGLGAGLAMGFETGFEVGLVVSDCGRGSCWGSLGAEVDAPTAVVEVDADRARAGCGKLCRDGGGERRLCKGRDGAAIGEEDRVIVSGIGFAVAGLGAAVAFSDGGGLVAL
jgi:hypothetical protein